MPLAQNFKISSTATPQVVDIVQALLQTGAVTPAPTNGGSQSSTAPAGPVADLVNAIPVAEDGEVIRSSFHNSLRDALIALLAEIGVGRGPIAPLSPALLSFQGVPGWNIGAGFAVLQAPNSGPKASASGWLPLELPHGGTIQNLTVTGRRVGAMSSFAVTLVRQALTAELQPATNLIAAGDLSQAGATFSQPIPTGAPDNPNATAQDIADRKLIDNTKYKYYVTADVDGAENSSRAQINSIQVVVYRV
jgi:hypothetical protein